MASEIMLMGLNRKTRKTKRVASAAQKANRRRFAALARSRGGAVAATGTRHKRRSKARRIMGAVSRRARRAYSSQRGQNIMSMMKASGVAAAGGVLLDIGYNYLPIPANLKTGPVQHLVKAAGAVGIALLGKHFLPARTAEQLAVGALTVTMYGALRAVANTAIPTLKLGMYDDLGMYDVGGGMLPKQYAGATPALGYTGAGMVSPGGVQIGAMDPVSDGF